MGEQQGGVEGAATEDRRGCGPGLTTEGGLLAGEGPGLL